MMDEQTRKVLGGWAKRGLVVVATALVVLSGVSAMALLLVGQGPGQTLATPSCELLRTDLSLHSSMVTTSMWCAAGAAVALCLLSAGEDRVRWRAALGAGAVMLVCIGLIMNDLRRVNNAVVELAVREGAEGSTCPKALLKWYTRRSAAMQRVVGADP